MKRLFWGNFSFEDELSVGHSQSLSQHQAQLAAERAANWLAIAEAGDCVWTPVAIPPEFWTEAAGSGFAQVTALNDFKQLAAGEWELVPWGWSAPMMKLAKQLGAAGSKPDVAVVAEANSRAWSVSLEQSLGLALPGTAIIQSLAEFSDGIAALADNPVGRRVPEPDSQAHPSSAGLNQGGRGAPGWVLKANWGMSGRSRILGAGPPTAEALAWLTRQLRQQPVVVLEPWVELVEEAGIQIEVPGSGAPMLQGVTPLLSTARGQYWGSAFQLPPISQVVRLSPQTSWRMPSESSHARRWEAAVAVALQAAELLQRQGYRGPLGIDAAWYRDADGEEHLRPLQDINARWTMGRLSLGLRRLARPGESGLWLHEPATAAHPTWQTGTAVRQLATTPVCVGGQPAQSWSAAYFFSGTH